MFLVSRDGIAVAVCVGGYLLGEILIFAQCKTLSPGRWWGLIGSFGFLFFVCGVHIIVCNKLRRAEVRQLRTVC